MNSKGHIVASLNPVGAAIAGTIILVSLVLSFIDAKRDAEKKAQESQAQHIEQRQEER